MVYSVMVFAARNAGITHEEFKDRYEQHMRMVAELVGDAHPISHTRWYPKHGPDGKPVLMAGDAAGLAYDCIVNMAFTDEAAFQRFFAALTTDEANAKIEADEAGFWDRSTMKVVAIDDTREWRP